jgi:pyoverdine/dityrosine biosynthesis protein Dit1
MTAQEYILFQLENLNSPVKIVSKPKTDSEIVEAVLKSLLSKKFRKFSIPEKNKTIIRQAVEKNIQNNEPIKITWPFGGYKLWSLTETPEPDWAELFTMIYLAQWLKPVCAIYQPGAVLTFWEDEVVISKMNNIPQSDLDTYHKSFINLISFISSYLPKNLVFDDFQEREQYKNTDAFEAELAVEMQKLKEARAKNPQRLSEAAIHSIDLNVKVTPEQKNDLVWREKIDLTHNA